jgi:transposase-like protein
MKRRRISEWHRSRLSAAYRRTRSVCAAARAARVSLPTAYRYLADQHRSAVPTFKTRIRNEALRLYLSGLSCRAVARELAKTHRPAPSQESVHQWMKAAGVLRSKRRSDELMNARVHGRDYDQIRRDARRLAADKLWSVRRIAETLQVSRGVVKRAIARSPLRPDHILNPADATLRRMWQAYLPDVEERRRVRDEVITRRERGETLKSIAVATGKSEATVWKYCREAGLTKPLNRQTAHPAKTEVAA